MEKLKKFKMQGQYKGKRKKCIRKEKILREWEGKSTFFSYKPFSHIWSLSQAAAIPYWLLRNYSPWTFSPDIWNSVLQNILTLLLQSPAIVNNFLSLYNIISGKKGLFNMYKHLGFLVFKAIAPAEVLLSVL